MLVSVPVWFSDCTVPDGDACLQVIMLVTITACGTVTLQTIKMVLKEETSRTVWTSGSISMTNGGSTEKSQI